MKRRIRNLILTCICLILLCVLLPVGKADAASKVNLKKCSINVESKNVNYTGSAIKPKVTVKYGKKTLKLGKDYKLAYENNIIPGTAKITITGKGSYKGTITKNFTIKNGLTVSLASKSATYTGSAIKPKVKVKAGKTKLATKYYSVTYKNNKTVGTAEVIIKGKGKYAGKNAYVTFKIKSKSVENATVTLSETKYRYTGEACKPEVTVKSGSTKLDEGTDYTVEYADNINVGTAKVTIKGIGNYTKSVTKTFTIEGSSSLNPANAITYPGEYTYVSLGDKLKNSSKTIEWKSSDESVAIIRAGRNKDEAFVEYLSEGKVVISATDGTNTEVFEAEVKPLSKRMIFVTKTAGRYSSNNTSSKSGFTFGQAASSVIGQAGLEKANGSEFNNPNGMAYCKIGSVFYYFVSDVYNNRVLVYKGETVKKALNSEPAYAIGQKDINSASPGYSLSELNWPMSVAVDSWTLDGTNKYRLYVADTRNDRILVYNDVESLGYGASADVEIKYLSGEGNDEIGWPWSVASVDVNGTQKLIIAATESAKVGIYNVPTDNAWGRAGCSFDNKADVVIDFGATTTPRAITWTGTQLLIGDENIPNSNGGNQSGFWVINSFPEESDSINNLDYFTFFPSVGYGEGAVIDNKLYILYASGWNIFNKNADGKFLAGADDTPDLTVAAVRGAGDSRYPEEGYFIDAGGTQKALYVKEEGTLYLSCLGRYAILGWSNPTVQLVSKSTMAPDIFIGTSGYETKVNQAASDYVMHNPDVSSDGKHLAIANDLDTKLYVYKSIPTSDGAIADYEYDMEYAPADVCLYTDDNGKTTMFVVGMAHNVIYVWEDYKFDGSMPNKVIAHTLGNTNFTMSNYNIYSVFYDGTYFYIGYDKYGERNIYVYRGVPQKTDNYIAEIKVNASATYGLAYSNGKYLAVSDDKISVKENNGGTTIKQGAEIYKTEIFASATAASPLLLTEDKAYGTVTAVSCGNLFRAKPGRNIYLYEWENSSGKHVSYQSDSISFVGDCIITDDGMVAMADSGNNRVVIWNSVEDAINNTKNVTVIGNGENTKYGDDDEFVGVTAAFKDSLSSPKRLAYDGKNLWVGEFKFANRLMRFSR